MCDVREKEMHCSVGLGEEWVNLLSTVNNLVIILTQEAAEPTLGMPSLLGHQGIWTTQVWRIRGLELTTGRCPLHSPVLSPLPSFGGKDGSSSSSVTWLGTLQPQDR